MGKRARRRGTVDRMTAPNFDHVSPHGDVLTLRGVQLSDSLSTQEVNELGEVSAIRQPRILGEPAFHRQVIEKSIDQLFHPTASLVGQTIHIW